MADVRRTWSPEPEFEYTDYNQDWQNDTAIIITCQRTVNLLAGLVDTLGFVNTRWLYDGSSNIPDVALADIENWLDETRRSLIMACDGERISIALERIANALDGGSEIRHDLDAIVTALEDIDTGLDITDFVDLVSFFKVLVSKIPSLSLNLAPIDLAKLAMDVRYKASTLNYLEDIALSQRGIVISQGGLPIQGIYENLGDTFNAAAAGITGGESAGIQWIWQVIKGKDIQIGQDLIDLLNSILFGSVRSATYDVVAAIEAKDIEAIETIITTLANELAELNLKKGEGNTIMTAVGEGIIGQLASISDCTCTQSGSGGGCCTCGGGAAILDPPTVDLGDGIPTDFADCAEYAIYKCKAANWLTDKVVDIAARFENMPSVLRNFEDAAFNGESWSLGQLNATVGGYVTQMLPPLWAANLTSINRGQLTTYATQLASDWLDAVSQAGSEAGLPAIEQAYFVTPMVDLISNLATYKNDTIQEVYQIGNTTDNVFDIVTGWISDAVQATGSLSQTAINFYTSVVSKGVSGLAFALADAIDSYTSAIECVGEPFGCFDGDGCFGVWGQGSQDAGTAVFHSTTTPTSGRYRLQFTIDTGACRNLEIWSNGEDPTEFVGANIYYLEDDTGVVYDSNTMPTQLFDNVELVRIHSLTEFSININWECV